MKKHNIIPDKDYLFIEGGDYFVGMSGKKLIDD
jgi:hypothetical protein